MGENGSDEDSAGSGASTPIDVYRDAVDRSERTLDQQIELINGIDNKAEHITRLIALVIGLVFSVLSLTLQNQGLQFEIPPVPTLLAFGAGIALLLLSMGAAIITYLSSKFKIGLHPSVGRLLSNPDYQTDNREHLRRTLGTYAYNLEQNRKVIEANSYRFRWSLLFLLTGIFFLSIAGTLYLGNVGSEGGWAAIILTGLIPLAVAWYILTGRFLTLRSKGGTDESKE
jgi:hypothetical protein